MRRAVRGIERLPITPAIIMAGQLACGSLPLLLLATGEEEEGEVLAR